MDWREAYLERTTSLAGGRVYWDERNQSDGLPALVLQSISDGRPQHFKGFDLGASRVQFDCYGSIPKDAWDLAEAAIALMVHSGESNGHIFQRADIESGPRSLTERSGSQTEFLVSFDLLVHHSETDAS